MTKKVKTVKQARIGAKTGADSGMKLSALVFNASKENREVALAAGVDILRPILMGNHGDVQKSIGNVTMLRSAFKMDATQYDGLWPIVFRGSLLETANLSRFRDVAGTIAGYLAAENLRITKCQMSEIDEKTFRKAEKALRALTADPAKLNRLQVHAAYVLDALGDLIEPAVIRVAEKAAKAAMRKAKAAAAAPATPADEPAPT